MLFAFKDRRGLILFDEPDIHISPFNVSSFLEEIFRIAWERSPSAGIWQFLCASHSGAAQLAAKSSGILGDRKTQVQVLRREIDDTEVGTRLVCNYNDRFFSQMGPLYTKLAKESRLLQKSARRASVVTFFHLLWESINEYRVFKSSYMTCLSLLMASFVLSGGADVFVPVSNNPDLHQSLQTVAKRGYGFSLLAAIVTLGALFPTIRKFIMKRPSRKVG